MADADSEPLALVVMTPEPIPADEAASQSVRSARLAIAQHRCSDPLLSPARGMTGAAGRLLSGGSSRASGTLLFETRTAGVVPHFHALGVAQLARR